MPDFRVVGKPYHFMGVEEAVIYGENLEAAKQQMATMWSMGEVHLVEPVTKKPKK